jgi:diguanylate cyclase (GGDEF)-like protein
MSNSPDQVWSTEYLIRLISHFHAISHAPGYKARELPEEFAEIENAKILHNTLWAIRDFADSLSRGDLGHANKERGYVVGALKSFQSSLRHLTWQAQRIAAGEYQHRVTFLGDFAIAFNHMAEQLAGTIEKLVHQTEEYKDISLKDELTGLYNRKAFSQMAKLYLSQQANPSGSGRLAICDIDHFKKINDTYGHLCGDKVLRMSAQTLAAALRPTDFCFRYGGEEFIFVATNISRKAGIQIVDRLRVSIQQLHIEFEQYNIQITSSFGLTEFKPVDANADTGECLVQILRRADACLYKAKDSGRNCVVASPEI